MSELAKTLLPDNYQPNPPTSKLAKILFESMPESSPWWRLRYESKLDIEEWHISALQARTKLRVILMSHAGVDEESGISLRKGGNLEFSVKYFIQWLKRFGCLHAVNGSQLSSPAPRQLPPRLALAVLGNEGPPMSIRIHPDTVSATIRIRELAEVDPARGSLARLVH